MEAGGEQLEGPILRARRSRRSIAIALAVGVGAFVAAGGGFAGYAIARSVTPVQTHTVYCASPAAISSTSSGQSLATAADLAAPSVVAITAKSIDVSVTGSGIIIRSDGVILTNNHVIANVAVNGGAITVTFANGKKASADVIGRAPDSDIALIRAKGVDGIQPAILGSAASLTAGEQVLVIGTALGEPGTVTAGIISALGRSACATAESPSETDQQLYGTKPWLPEQLTLTDLIQTDAPIDAGVSGGALVNASGAVVGVCTAFTGDGVSSSETGVGFAIRIDVAYNIAKQLLGSS